jgi:hypothetical protein
MLSRAHFVYSEAYPDAVAGLDPAFHDAPGVQIQDPDASVGAGIGEGFALRPHFQAPRGGNDRDPLSTLDEHVRREQIRTQGGTGGCGVSKVPTCELVNRDDIAFGYARNPTLP